MILEPGDEHLLAILKLRGKIDRGNLGLGGRPSGHFDRLLHNGTRWQVIDSWPTHRAAYMDSQRFGGWRQGKFDGITTRFGANQCECRCSEQSDQDPRKQREALLEHLITPFELRAIALIIIGHWKPGANQAIIAVMTSSSMGNGDDGYTGLIGKGRVPKYHPRPDAYGTVDEASAALGLARSLTQSDEISRITEAVQRDLYALMAELATLDMESSKAEPFSGERVSWLEQQIQQLEKLTERPKEFVVGGDAPAGAAFDLARTIVRRAERLVARLLHTEEIRNSELLRYLNRLSSLCFLLSIREYQLAGIDRPSLAGQESE
jgi:cob(I)alamin adenosyltransferase